MPRRALWLVQRLPREVWIGLAAVALLVVSWVSVSSYGASRYAEGRRSVTTSAESVTPSVAVVRGADSTAKAKTDTVLQRIVVTRWRIDTLLRDVPDTLQTVPQIAALMTATQTLTRQVDTLTHTLNVERAVGRLRASTDSAALVASALTIVHKQDEIMALKRRPQWRTVAAVGVLGVVAGLLR